MHSIGYALLHVKGFSDSQRSFSGIASTPELDRQNHVIDPAGVTYRNPLPLLFFHDQKKPIGKAILQPPTAEGIAFEAWLPEILEPGALKDRVDEAWQSIKAGLITGVSIGFRVMDDAVKKLKDGGYKLLKTEVVELSLVTIPANVDATILAVKTLAASGLPLPCVQGSLPVVKLMPPKDTNKISDQIAAFETTKKQKSDRMLELMQKAADAGETLDDAQTAEYDGLAAEVKSIDAHLVRLRDLEQSQVASATAITPVTTQQQASNLRSGQPVIQVKSNVPKGTAFVRYCMAQFRARGDSMRALEYAKQWKDSTPEVELMVKAAVAPGDTTTPAWAGVLVQIRNAENEFLELLRPATILGKIPNLRQVPFNTQVPLQTGGGTYGWVGQGKLKPVGKLALTTTAIQFSKAAGIIVITEELAKLSSPSAETIVRADMIAGISAFLDQQFIDPAVAVVANVSPASVTNGAGTAASADNASQDLATILGFFSGANIPLSGITLIMSEQNALAMGLKRDAMGNKLFPDMGVAGGNAEGINVIASNAAQKLVIGVSGPNILYADEGGIQIDVSREASVLMDSAPPAAPDATAVYTSLWQNNLVGLRAERMINWQRARVEAVYYLTDAAYTI